MELIYICDTFSAGLPEKMLSVLCSGVTSKPWNSLYSSFLQAKSNTYCFESTAQGQPQKQKYSPKVVLERSCSDKFHKFHRKEPLINLWHFLRTCNLCLSKRSSITGGFYDFRKVLDNILNSHFKEIANKRKTDGKDHN